MLAVGQPEHAELSHLLHGNAPQRRHVLGQVVEAQHTLMRPPCSASRAVRFVRHVPQDTASRCTASDGAGGSKVTAER
jgi:hypothetical protein